MARKNTPQPLTILDDSVISIADNTISPLSPTTPKSPRSPFAKFSSGRKLQKDRDIEKVSMQTESQQSRAIPPSQIAPSLASIAAQQPTEKQERPAKSGFFSNYKAAKSASRLQQQQTLQTNNNQTLEESMSRDGDRAGVGHVSSQGKPRSESSQDRATGKRKPSLNPKSSDLSVDQVPDVNSTSLTSQTSQQTKKTKPKPFAILNRTRSLRDEEEPSEASPPLHQQPVDGQTHLQPPSNGLAQNNERPREMPPPTTRQRSDDRRPGLSREGSQGREGSKHQPSFSTSGHSFLSNLKGTAVKGAGALSKGLFGKGGRSGSTTEKEPVIDDEHYVLKVLNKPLVEQTRITRISKRLETSRDKTEFWMPAFPWRAIDYLNYKGSEVEGLYRVPGSAHEIKKWQRRFDEEHDIDLFRETDLYDINIIGSMLKAWLRELPEPILPKRAQDRVAREAPDSTTVPDVLVEELQNLPPFNYYLLFAITCHLSLLLAHADKNKMGYQNLLICFQPCMKIDSACFKFLVCNWRDCWKGCRTEEKYITEEYKLFETQPPNSADGSVAAESVEEWGASSAEHKQPSIAINDKSTDVSSSQTQGEIDHIQNTTLQLKEEKGYTPSELKRLSEIKPLSPMDLPHTRD